MPVYEYACADCGYRFEYAYKIGDVRELKCPSCGSKSVSKLISIPGLVRSSGLSHGGRTCCGRTERCEKPPCSSDGRCHR
jgi:putative FmdB family regulatory protein